MLLLDTCTLLWLAADQSKLSKHALAALSEAQTAPFVSAISAFEIGIKNRKGALTLPIAPEAWFERALEAHALIEIPVSGRIAVRSTALPPLHGDPCDRIIIATAQIHSLRIVTPDHLIASYPETMILW